jgi:hypothetical protein
MTLNISHLSNIFKKYFLTKNKSGLEKSEKYSMWKHILFYFFHDRLVTEEMKTLRLSKIYGGVSHLCRVNYLKVLNVISKSYFQVSKLLSP